MKTAEAQDVMAPTVVTEYPTVFRLLVLCSITYILLHTTCFLGWALKNSQVFMQNVEEKKEHKMHHRRSEEDS